MIVNVYGVLSQINNFYRSLSQQIHNLNRYICMERVVQSHTYIGQTGLRAAGSFGAASI